MHLFELQTEKQLFLHHSLQLAIYLLTEGSDFCHKMTESSYIFAALPLKAWGTGKFNTSCSKVTILKSTSAALIAIILRKRQYHRVFVVLTVWHENGNGYHEHADDGCGIERSAEASPHSQISPNKWSQHPAQYWDI